jgi:hypothetical protein
MVATAQKMLRLRLNISLVNGFSPSPVGGISNDLADVVYQPSQMLSCFIRGVGVRGDVCLSCVAPHPHCRAPSPAYGRGFVKALVSLASEDLLRL